MRTMDGLWLTSDYGQLLEVKEGTLQLCEITSASLHSNWEGNAASWIEGK